MYTKSLVSIVTPCFNGEKYIERFLKSVLAQSYPNIELIIVDDGSIDRTQNVIERYQEEYLKHGKKIIYCFQENAGQAAATNRGLQLFHGEYLLWVDSDDAFSENFVQARVEFLEKNPGCMYCYGKAILISENDGKIICVADKRSSCNSFFEDILWVNDVFYSGYMVRKSAFDKAVYKRDIYTGRGGQNAQLLLPLAWYYGEPGFVTQSEYFYYKHQDSHSSSQNTTEKRIQQLHNYEVILVETIKRINDQKATEYIDEIQKHYAHLRFGNAVDTKNAEMIKKYYKELQKLRTVAVHDFVMFIKYASKFTKICKQ